MPKQKIMGEGDYEATRRYRKRTDEFLKNNDVDKAATRAAPESQPGICRMFSNHFSGVSPRQALRFMEPGLVCRSQKTLRKPCRVS